jgi:hypothetical protein
VVQNILKKRLVDGEEQYYVRWAGCKSSENTWEPAQNLLEYGAEEYVKEFEDKIKNGGKQHMVKHDDAYMATETLIRKHKLRVGTLTQWMKCGNWFRFGTKAGPLAVGHVAF